jgi:hypothetical protein
MVSSLEMGEQLSPQAQAFVAKFFYRAAYLANPENSASARQTGANLVKASLFLLLALFLFFVALVIQ